MEESTIDSPRELSGLDCGWITCFCVVNFDLEYGQKLDYSVPSHTFLADEISNICFSSFPDSNEERELDSVFVFRIRREGLPQADHEVHHDVFRLDRLQPDIDSAFYYGFAYFRQREDPSNPRGYMQRAVVLITPQPFFGLYHRLMQIVGPMFFDFGEALLESTIENINQWPPLRADQRYELPLLGRVLIYRVSSIMFPALDSSLGGPGTPHSGVREVLTDHQSVPLYELFSHFLRKLWSLWELVLIGQPLLVIGSSPEVASKCILALMSLIRPIQYSGDFRPYLTVYDTDFGVLSNPFPADDSTGEPIMPSLLIGGTNPFFIKSMSHWPHVLKIGFSESSSKWRKKRSATTTLKEDFTSSHKTRTPIDDRLLDSLSEEPSPDTANEKIRQHFLQLTEQFLRPLQRYLDEYLFTTPKSSPHFEKKRFLELLKDKKLTTGGVKKKQIRLYEQFLESRNFTVWFNSIGRS